MNRSLFAAAAMMTCLAGSALGQTKASRLAPMWDVYVATAYTTKYEVMVEHPNGTTSSRGIFDERWEAEIEVIYQENYDPYDGLPVSAAVMDAWIVEVEVPSRWRRYGRYPSEFGAALVSSLLEHSGLDTFYERVLVFEGLELHVSR